MTDTTPPATTTPRARPRPKPTKYKVKKVDENGLYPTISPFDTEGEARRFIRNNHPRGRNVFLESPDGTREHYSADHAHQESGDGWFPFEDEDDELWECSRTADSGPGSLSARWSYPSLSASSPQGLRSLESRKPGRTV